MSTIQICHQRSSLQKPAETQFLLVVYYSFGFIVSLLMFLLFHTTDYRDCYSSSVFLKGLRYCRDANSAVSK